MADILKASKYTSVNLKAPAINQTLRRALIHSSVGLCCAVTVFFLPRVWAVAGIATLTVIFLGLELSRLRILPGNRYISAAFSPFIRKNEATKVTGASYLLVGCLLTAWIFPKDIAVFSILFLSLGDPLATVIGTWKGKHYFQGKSLEGHLACLLICLISGTIVVQFPEYSNTAVMVTGVLCASVLQALPLPSRLNDNLIIPIGSATAMLIVRTITA